MNISIGGFLVHKTLQRRRIRQESIGNKSD